ncbi:hypothetical protein BT69DRAFT_1277638 [Atractiella rhizophila]|nr:hypothetical protein BT69DRAFT_1277638 [Atractiella rhizophila]
MARMEATKDFRPFKFRIQSFTNAFSEELARHGMDEEEVPLKKVRQYLWTQPYISRFNDEGKKAKSKGNHVWMVEGKKDPECEWIFKAFERRILPERPAPTATPGRVWSYKPHVWDPQQPSASISVQFSSPDLPSWLSWNDGTLSGVPTEGDFGGKIIVRASFTVAGKNGELEKSFEVEVGPEEEEEEEDD